MALAFHEWASNDAPGEVIDVSTDAGWDLIRERYADSASQPLERILEIAKCHGVQSVIIEYRYIDADWRNEHEHFYGGTFRRYPSVAHRLHFFAAPISADFGELGELSDLYRGYSVMRPLAGTPVGRTMIQPPPEMSGANSTFASETVNIFGHRFEITAMPFISQDAQYLRCAHASIWMVLRHATRRYGLPKRLPGDIREAAAGGFVVGRQLPSDGLSASQMLNAMDTLGVPTGILEPLPDTGPDQVPTPGSATLYGVVCRYINSQLPPIVVSLSHAWVVVGWSRESSGGHKRLTLWRHDDARGPYIRVDNPWDEAEEAHRPWRMLLNPLMPRMNIDAERAEATGATWLELSIPQWSQGEHGTPGRAAEALAAGEIAYHTYAVPSNEYKERLAVRGLDPEIVRLYRTTHMPKYIWVIEAVDRVARRHSLPAVLGEFILDSTAASPNNLALTSVLAAHVEGVAISQSLDHGTTRQVAVSATGAYLSDQDAR